MFSVFKTERKTKDPVCGMEIDKDKTQFSVKINGKMYYFCSENCQQKFNTKPEAYAAAPAQNKSGGCHDNNSANKSCC